MTHPIFLRVGLIVALVASTSACRSHAGFRQQYMKSRSDLIRGDWQKAAEDFERSKDELFQERDRVMYWLNLGTLLHYAEQWEASQKNFVLAERAIQDLFTKSVTAEVSKYTVSETLAPYPGEDFEKILLYYFTAVNNIEQGKVTDALVEARRADDFLKKIRIRYEQDDELSTIYKQDAFMLWMVGLFYELEGSHNDAFLAYKRAYKIYEEEYRDLFGTRTPSYLAEDVVRSGLMANLREDADAFGRAHGATGGTAALGRSQAEIIFIHAGGEAPHKEQTFLTAPMPDGYILRIAFPKFKRTKPVIVRSVIEIGGKSENTEMAEPVTTIALKNFQHQRPGLTARAIARATIKYAATKGTKKIVEGGNDSSSGRKLAGALIGLFGNIAAAATENADLRTWSLLPAYFRVSRAWVPAGHHTLTVRYLDARGNQVGPPQTIELDLEPGQRKIISVRTVR